MEKLYEYVKNTVVHFKLDTCCCIAPIRVGLLCIGYFNIIISLLSLVGTAEESFAPPLMAVQASILEDDFSKSLGTVAYATEMAFNTLLLSGIYRSDIQLLRVYIYFVIGSIISSVLVYSIVFIRVTALMKALIIWTLAFQFYQIILVRSVIVEIKETRTSEKNGHVTLYSVVRMPDDVPTKGDEPDPEVTVELQNTVEPQVSKKEEYPQNEESVHPDQNKDELPSKMETINEHVKEK